MLRDYQSHTISLLKDWLQENKSGHPCVVLPTGSGKSHVIAELCRDTITHRPNARVLMLTSRKELIRQNISKLWPDAPVGVYSASIGRKEVAQITFAGIQSVRDKADVLGSQDLVLVDEAHEISHTSQGAYRKLIKDLSDINPDLRVVGFTASPFRLGHGLITEGDALFSALIEPVKIESLVVDGYLAPLRSKLTQKELDVASVKKRGGEFIEKDLQIAVDTDENNRAVVQEVLALAGDRQHWLIFCTGIEHAKNICSLLSEHVSAACVTGETPKAERDRIIEDFKSGRIKALTNANILTTGFDFPDIDLIALLRPTMSPGLYMQMAGRGLRPKSHTDHCLVLDFAGAVKMHGPITAVKSPSQKVGSVGGEALVKVCSHCSEICYASQKCCHVCGDEFPIPEMKQLKLDADADIMGEMAKANNLVSFARIGPRGKPAAIFNWNEVDKLIEDGFSALDIANKSGTALSTFCQAIKREFQISFSEYSREKLQKRNARQARYRQKQGRSRLELMVTPELQERFKSLAGLENMTNYEKLKILCDSWDKCNENQQSKDLESIRESQNKINELFRALQNKLEEEHLDLIADFVRFKKKSQYLMSKNLDIETMKKLNAVIGKMLGSFSRCYLKPDKTEEELKNALKWFSDFEYFFNIRGLTDLLD